MLFIIYIESQKLGSYVNICTAIVTRTFFSSTFVTFIDHFWKYKLFLFENAICVLYLYVFISVIEYWSDWYIYIIYWFTMPHHRAYIIFATIYIINFIANRYRVNCYTNSHCCVVWDVSFNQRKSSINLSDRPYASVFPYSGWRRIDVLKICLNCYLIRVVKSRVYSEYFVRAKNKSVLNVFCKSFL